MDNEEKLAIDGGEPVRKNYLNYARQYIDESDVEAVVEVLKSDFLTCGPKIREMERKLCEITGASFAAAVSSGTAALHTACLAAGIEAGDEVIVTPMTFAASANCILYCGGIPVFTDIDPDTWNISPEKAESMITERSKALIAVDFMGQAASLGELAGICKKHGLRFIEDAAHSIGTRYAGVPVGSIADITTFSFHPVKTVTAGEGGAVATNDFELYERSKMYSAHGITRDSNKLNNKENGKWYYEQQSLGYNYRITDIQAALCVSQMGKLEIFSRRRKEIVALYNSEFSKMDEIILPKVDPKSDTVRHLYMIRLRPELLKTERKTIYEALQAENIGVNVHYIPVYRLSYYERLGYKRGLCPNAESLYESSLTLPLHYSMADADVEDVIRAVKKVVHYYRK